jgi:hypothetical protein
MDEQDCHRQTIPGASEYVRVRRDDLMGVLGLAKDHESYQKYGFERAAIDRLKKALEPPCPDQ